VHRSYFTFDIQPLSAPIASAQVVFRPNGLKFGLGQDYDLNLWSFSGNIDSLVNGSAGMAAFNDLGSGTLLGTASVFLPTSLADVEEITVNLNSAAHGLIESSAGARFVFGADLPANAPSEGNYYIWRGSSLPDTATLNVELVPEINSGGFAVIAFILGSLGLWLYSSPSPRIRPGTA